MKNAALNGVFGIIQTIMDKRTQQNKDFFNSLANDWDARQKLSDDDVFNLVKLANINHGDKVLDVACGTGIIDKYLLKS